MAPGNFGRFARFVAGGAINTGATYAIYLALLPFLSYQYSYLIAYAAGILIAYIFNSLIVFRVTTSVGRFSLYSLVLLAQYAISAGLLAVLVDFAGLSAKLAPLLTIAVMIPVSFGLNYVALAWRRRSAPTGTELQDP